MFSRLTFMSFKNEGAVSTVAYDPFFPLYEREAAVKTQPIVRIIVTASVYFASYQTDSSM
jgi:hypothetical protein